MATQIQTNDIEDLAITAAKLAPGAGGTGVYQRFTIIIGTVNSPYTGSTTLVNLPFSYVADGKSLNVYRDGIHLEPGASADYQETSTSSITFNSAQTVGNKVLLETIVASAPATTTFDRREDYVVGTALNNYTGSTTVFDLVQTYTLGNKNVQVYVDGVLMTPGASLDYQETTSSRVTFNSALTAGQAVSFVFKQAAAANNADQVDGFNASATPTANYLLPLNTNTQLAIGDGTIALPALSFNSDPDTGIWRSTSNTIDFTSGGTNCLSIAVAGGVVIRGTNTNDSAATGFVGEYVESVVGNSNAAATGQYYDVTSISLTAGDWDISAMCGTAEANGATWTQAELGISTTSGNSGTGLVSGKNDTTGYWSSTSTNPLGVSLSVMPWRLSLSATTTVYLKGRFVYSAGTPRFAGVAIRARRVR